MHDFLVLLTFVGLVFLPCVVAVQAGAADDEVNGMRGRMG